MKSGIILPILIPRLQGYEEEEESDDPEDAPTSPLLQNGFRMGAGRISYVGKQF